MADYKIKQYLAKHPECTYGGLQHQKFNQDKNGAKELGVFKKCGRTVLVDEERRSLWIDLQTTGELDAVVKLIHKAKEQGKYISPEDAVAQIRGGGA